MIAVGLGAREEPTLAVEEAARAAERAQRRTEGVEPGRLVMEVRIEAQKAFGR